MLPPYSTNEPMEFSGRIVWDLVRSKLAAPRHHLMGGKPDTQVHELNKSAAVCPPHEAKLLDDEQTKPSVGLFRCAFRIGSSSHMASLVSAGRDWASAVPVRAALILGHTSPVRLTIWA
jgi:hypothetical protein